jgi:hypothetical protein
MNIHQCSVSGCHKNAWGNDQYCNAHKLEFYLKENKNESDNKTKKRTKKKENNYE